MILLVKLVLAHLLGDFLWQPASRVKAKKLSSFKGYWLYLHVLLHGIVTMLLVWNWVFWPWALLIMAIHLLIDSAIIVFQKENTKRLFFLLDQLAHLIALVLIWMGYEEKTFRISPVEGQGILLWMTALFFLTLPVSTAVKIFISKWTSKESTEENMGLQSAGKYIGFLERLLVFVFIVTHHWEAVGFLVTAKSIFRFGDLTASKDRELTEYVLIGTLLSFGIAIGVGIGFQYLTWRLP